LGLSLRARALTLFILHQIVMHIATVSSINVALPAMMEEFQVDVATAVWVQLSYTLALVGGTIPFGPISASFNKRAQVLIGQVIDIGAMLATFFTTSIYVVIAARFISALARTPPWLCLQVMGVGGFPPNERGKIVGLNRLVQGTAVVLSVPLTGWVTDQWGWRWLFMGTVVISAALTVAIWLLLPGEESRPEGEEPFDSAKLDLAGGGLMMVGAVGVVMSLQSFVRGQLSTLGVAMGVLGLVALVAFFRVELRARSPILYLPLFRVREIFVSAMQAIFLGFANGAVLLLLPFLYIKGYGWTAAYAGSMLLFFNLARPPSSFLGGWLADRFGSMRVVAPASLVLLAGLLIAAGISPSPGAGPGLVLPIGLIIAALLLMGLGDSLAASANLRQIFSAMPREHLALAPSTNLVLMLLGSTIGQAFVAAALELAGASRATGGGNPEVVSAGAMVLVAISVVFAIGMLLAHRLPSVIPAVGRRTLERAQADSALPAAQR
jgi:MFS family permease